MNLGPTRRRFLAGTLGTACSAAASPLLTPVLHAAVPGDNRLVVIVLRGAMDGLDLVQPWGDRAFLTLRPSLALAPGAGITDLDGFFGLHDVASGLLPLWQAGELAFVHAASTPYRDRRSHFDGQDLLETGGDGPERDEATPRDGWLNRMLGLMPGAVSRTAIAAGTDNMLILEGRNAASEWSPTTELALADDERRLLTRLYAEDPLFASALAAASELGELAGEATAQRETGETLAGFVAGMLNAEARIAAFSIGGWDTHRNQANAFRRPATELAEAIVTLRARLGANWARTTVIAMTEFGRTAAENGNGGTDHGTGGVAVLAGGTLRGGRVAGRWPGLEEALLYERRDLMPTDDVRRVAAWAIRTLLPVDRAAIEGTVFPGLELGEDPRLFA